MADNDTFSQASGCYLAGSQWLEPVGLERQGDTDTPDWRHQISPLGLNAPLLTQLQEVQRLTSPPSLTRPPP